MHERTCRRDFDLFLCFTQRNVKCAWSLLCFLIGTQQNKRRREAMMGWEVNSNFKALFQPSEFGLFRECGMFIRSYPHGFFRPHISHEWDDSFWSDPLSVRTGWQKQLQQRRSRGISFFVLFCRGDCESHSPRFCLFCQVRYMLHSDKEKPFSITNVQSLSNRLHALVAFTVLVWSEWVTALQRNHPDSSEALRFGWYHCSL